MGIRKDDEEIVRLLIKGAISELPEETQNDIKKCRLEMLEVIGRYQAGIGHMALGIMVAELSK